MSLTLYTYPGNYRAWKTQIAAAYSGVTLDIKDSKELKETLYNKAPVLATPHGHLFESNAIAHYIAGIRSDNDLNGANSFQAAQVRQWLDFSSFDIEAARSVWLLPIRGVLTFNQQAYSAAKKDLKESLTVLNTHLTKNTFLVGNKITLADIAITCALVELFQEVLDTNFRRGLEAVVRWFNTCINQKEFSAVLGKVTMAKKETRAPMPKKKAAPAAAAAAEPKKAAKPKNPLELLPPSTMHLDPVKKLFFSCKGPDEFSVGNPKFFSEFWKMFDDKGWSFWSAEFNANQNNKEFWKTQNATTFYIQRCDALRKYGFAAFNILGDNEDEEKCKWLEIVACFLVRGTEEIPFELKDVPDSDYYEFKKMPTATDSDKQAVQAYFDGKKVKPCKKDGKKNLVLLERKFFK